MQSSRPLRPASAATLRGEQLLHRSLGQELAQSRPKNRKRHTAHEWAAVKKQILQLYAKYSLDQVIQIIKQQTGFEAGARQYKNKLAEWGSEKYLRGTDAQFVLAENRKRKLEGKSGASFLIKGVQLTVENLHRLEQRHAQKNNSECSQSHVTPDGLEYYTPFSPRNPSQPTPQAFTPATKFSAFARALHDYMKSDPLIAMLLDYDRQFQRTKLIEVEPGSREEAKARRHNKRNARNARKGSAEEDSAEVEQSIGEKRNQRQAKQKRLAHSGLRDLYGEDLKRHQHLVGRLSAAGSSRFSLGDTLQTMLWQAQTLARSMCDAIDSSEEQTKPLQRDSRGCGNCPGAAQYCLTAQPEAFPPQDISPLLDLIRTDSFVRHVLGMTQADYSRWTGLWSIIQEDHVVQALKLTADHLFGDIRASYPKWQSMSVLIRFELQQPVGKPVLMRFSFGQDQRTEFADCKMCENMVVIVELIGPSGALKLNVPLTSDDERTTHDKYENFEAAHDLQSRMVTSRWSSLAHQLQGSALLKHYRRCFCNGIVHQNGFKQHYIDMAVEETARKEKWEPNGDRVEVEEDFESHPLEPEGPERIFVENGDDSDVESEDDCWDPSGEDRDELEVFEPSPDDVEEQPSYVSRPRFLRVLG